MADFTNIDGKYVKDIVMRDDITYIKNAIGYNDIVGLQIDYENLTYMRLANAQGKNAGSDFDAFPMYGNRRKCCVADDGTINAFYGEQGYIEDGSNGQVMVYQPKFYYRIVPLKLEEQVHRVGETTTVIVDNDTTNPIMINGESYTAKTNDVAVYNDAAFRWDGAKWTTAGADAKGYHLLKANYYISAIPKAGFKLHPAFINESSAEVDYILLSAYEASVYDTSESKYMKYDSWDVTDNGDNTYTINNYNGHTADVTATTGDKLCSIAGVKPCSGEYSVLTRPNLEILAKNRGTGWHIYNAKVAMANVLLMIIEYGTPNSQDAIGNGVVSYASGTHNESVFTGSTASLGNGSGMAEKSARLVTGGTTYEENANNGYKSVCYRGCENDWGNIWNFIQGLSQWGNGKMFSGEPYVCTDFNYAENKKTDNYVGAGFTCANATSGYVRYFGYNNPDYDWLFVASKLGGTGTNDRVPVGDYNYFTANLNGFRVSRLGGHWASRRYAGCLYWHLNDGVDNRYRDIGARIVFYPQVV